MVDCSRWGGLWLSVALVVVSAISVYGNQDVQALNDQFITPLADEPSWFHVSTLSNEDIHDLAVEARTYVKQTEVEQNKTKAVQVIKRVKAEAKAKLVQQQLAAPDVNIEKESNTIAKIQAKLAMKLLHLDVCNTKLSECRAELGSSQEDSTTGARIRHAVDPDKGPDIKFPRTTASEDWKQKHAREKPEKKFWQPKGGPVVFPHNTATEQYVQDQREFSNPYDDEHKAGFKRPEDRVFKEDATAMVRLGNETQALNKAVLAAQYTKEQKAVETTAKTAIKAAKEHIKAMADAKKASRVPLRKETVQAYSATEKMYQECQANLKLSCK